MEDLGIDTDTAYLFKLSASKDLDEASDIWLRYLPAQRKILEIQPGTDSLIAEISYKPELLVVLESNCAE